MAFDGQAPPARGLILAAGLSSRMGDFKPLLPLRGKTLIENAADCVLNGGAAAITVVTGFRGDEISDLLRRRYGEKVQIVQNPDYDKTDMLRSVQIGCRAMPPCGAFFLLPGDMPAIRQETFRRLLDAWNGDLRAVFPALDGRRKHPPLIDRRLIPDILAYQGEDGLRGFWRRHEDWIRTVPVDDRGVQLDVDTPEDYRNCLQQFEQNTKIDKIIK